MILSDLRDKIERKKARLAVIGLGYVGLPLSCEFAQAGFDVLGIELRQDRVEKINNGTSPIAGNEPGLSELLTQIKADGKFHASGNYQELVDRDVILIAVETPVDVSNIPRYEALRAALNSLGPVLKYGSLVIIESTVSPGTMQNVVLPLLTESSQKVLNEGFYLGNCPERVMPGRLLANLRTISRVVGGMTPDTAETMAALYRHVVKADLDPTDCITAELVKTAENSYRDVQIAFANEIALICEAVGGDVWKVRELVNKSPGRQMHQPGAGVGGHCIPKDPWLLAYGVKDKDIPLRLIPAAREINSTMPLHMVSLLQDALVAIGRDIPGSRILVMGYAYLEESDDTRNSPSEILVDRLRQSGAQVVIHDSYVPEYQGNLIELANGCDAAIVMVKHRAYQNIDLQVLKNALRHPILVDGRGIFDAGLARQAGFVFRGVGQGK